MFGFYDPASLSFGKKSAAISFISATDPEDVTRVEINSAEEARVISAALETQKTHGITAKSGKLVEFRGSIAFNPKAPDEALLTPDSEDEFGRTIPVKLGFKVDSPPLPRMGYAIGQAVEQDGALIVYKLAMRPLTMGFDREVAAPGNANHLN